MTKSKRDGYVNLELEDMSETQEMVVNMFIHEGELREQDRIWEYLAKNSPAMLGDDDYDRGFDAGYKHAMEILNQYINGLPED